MKKTDAAKLLGSLLCCILLLCTACVSESAEAVTAENCDITVNLNEVKNLAVTPHLISQFYQYNNDHREELGYLPAFAPDVPPAWDDLAWFVFLNYADDLYRAEREYEDLTTAKFKETVDTYLENVTYQDGPSIRLDFDGSCYICPPTDTGGSLDFRLTSIARDDDGLYTASFDLLCFNEGEQADIDTSANARAIHDFVHAEEVMHYKSDYDRAIESIFVREDYADILQMYGQMTVTFRLTGDPEHPFCYVSCERADIPLY